MERTRLPPGFRFHPTDLELIVYYLKRKVIKKSCVEAISELNIYKFDPWDLQDKSFIKCEDREWYFFCPKDNKYAKAGKTNRTAATGYWKPTGKDRSVSYKGRVVGMVKTLIFYLGRPPKGQRTDWVMHEYRMQDQQLANTEVAQDAFVLCKLFHKHGPGPGYGSQYGATYKEDIWDDETPDYGGTSPTAILVVSTAASSQLLATPSTSELSNVVDPEVSTICPSAEQDPPSLPGDTQPLATQSISEYTNVGGLEVSSIGSVAEQDLPSLPGEIMEVDVESVWASLAAEESPLGQSDGHQNINLVGSVAFFEKDTFSDLQETQSFPDSYLQWNHLNDVVNSPRNLVEDGNIMEHMLNESHDYQSDLSLLCSGFTDIDSSQYCLNST